MTAIIPPEAPLYATLRDAIARGLMVLTDGQRTVVSDRPITGFVQLKAGIKQ